MTILVGNTPLSWGVHTAETASAPYQQVLDDICETGYAGCELGPWGYLPTEADTLRTELAARSLALTAACVPVRLTHPPALDAGAAHVLAVGRLLAVLGARHLVLVDEVERDSRIARQAGRVHSPRFSEDEWLHFSAAVTQIARQLQDATGLKLAFQPHVGTHIESPEEARLLLDRLDPDLMDLCLDTGHWRYAGGDPVQALRDHGQRIGYVHLSDCDPNIRQFCIDEQLTFYEATQSGVFCALGEGDVDFPAVIQHLQALRYTGWVVVEQDALLEEPGADRINARRNREYLRKLGL
jgi:inosose dehydratase